MIRIPVSGLACVTGDRLPLERALGHVVGVLDAYVNPATDCTYLTVDPYRFRPERAPAVLSSSGCRPIGVGARALEA